MRTSQQRWLKASEAAKRLGLNRRTVIERAKPRDGRPGEFGDGARFFPFPGAADRVRQAPARAGKGGVLPPAKLGEWFIEESALNAWASRGRVFLMGASRRVDGEAS